MNEQESYKWAAQAIRHTENLVEAHVSQRLADSVASAIMEAFKKGIAQQADTPDAEINADDEREYNPPLMSFDRPAEF